MKEKTDPIDQLFSDARQEQNRIASVVEIGVEARLENSLVSSHFADNDIWMAVLGRLCAGGGTLAIGLAVWAISPRPDSGDFVSLLIEQWVFGI